MIRIRSFPEKNYKAIYFNGKTMRLTYDPNKPIEDLDYPEFYDIKLTGRCYGNCPWCYQDSTKDGKDYEAVNQLTGFFGSMTENQKPFQIAFGGGETTLHYQFHEIMRLTREFGISPNYTTNGMFIHSDGCMKIIETTKKYCEGVAISCHDHLKSFWEPCAELMLRYNLFLNFHNIIGDRQTTGKFLEIYKKYSGRIKYFVVLPLINHGRAKENIVDFDYFFDKIALFDDISNIAFGANFYPELQKRKNIKVTLYEPEIMSKYLDLKDMNLYPSSFNTKVPIKNLNRKGDFNFS
jgi:organic radical activating enzyme